MKPKQYTHQLKYNSMETGKLYFNIKEARKEQKKLEQKGLWGYTVCLY
jgi:hypothetical protein